MGRRARPARAMWSSRLESLHWCIVPKMNGPIMALHHENRLQIAGKKTRGGISEILELPPVQIQRLRP